MDVLDSALLHSIQEVLDERILEEAVRRALEKIRAEQIQFPDHRVAIERELSLLATRLHHLVEAVARGEGSDSLFDSLRAEEARKKVLITQLAELNELGNVVSLDAKALFRKLEARDQGYEGPAWPACPTDSPDSQETDRGEPDLSADSEWGPARLSIRGDGDL